MSMKKSVSQPELAFPLVTLLVCFQTLTTALDLPVKMGQLVLTMLAGMSAGALTCMLEQTVPYLQVIDSVKTYSVLCALVIITAVKQNPKHCNVMISPTFSIIICYIRHCNYYGDNL